MRPIIEESHYMYKQIKRQNNAQVCNLVLCVHYYHVHGTGHWEVEGVECGLPLDNGSVPGQGEVTEVYAVWWGCGQVQILANHRLKSGLFQKAASLLLQSAFD